MRVTAQTPAWLPSAHSASPASPSAQGSSDLRAKTRERKASRSEEFKSFCSSASKPALNAALGSTPVLSSSWSAPPLSLSVEDPVLDMANASASPGWDGWSFKRQGRIAENMAASEAAQPSDDNDNISEHEDDHEDDQEDDQDAMFMMEEDHVPGPQGSAADLAKLSENDPYAVIVESNLKMLGKHDREVLRERTGSF